MNGELSLVSDMFEASKRIDELGSWKPGDSYMDEDLGNCRFIGWLGTFEKQIRETCDKCSCQIQHGDIWLNEQHTKGIPANRICVKYREIKSCYDAFDVAKTCDFIDKDKFKIYIKEMTNYKNID